MDVLSKKLSLVLAEYSELPENIQKNIDYCKKEVYRTKGEMYLFKTDQKYLYVKQDLFDKSLLTIIYGDRIDRVNEDSFDTLLHDYFTWYNTACRKSELTEEELIKFIKGMETYAIKNSIENLWHLLQMAKQCIKDSFEPNFSALLSFYSLIELLVLTDVDTKKRDITITEECGRKLSYFYKNGKVINVEKYQVQGVLNLTLSEYKVFEKLTKLRHKVIHGIFNEARDILDSLLPNKSTNTENAESSAFQDQIQNLNTLLRIELTQILYEWMIDPRKLEEIKKNLHFQE